ncbi:MAG: hypothetical protein ACFFAN_07545, partial [Promethearchaeota archaeon]
KILNIGSVNPGQEFKKDYEIQNLKEPCLTVEDILDTNREVSDVINNTFLYENVNKCSLKITLTNTLDIPYTEITVNREIPDIFQNIQIKAPSVGNAELTGEGAKRIIIWKVEGLHAKGTASLEILCDANINERKDQSLGSLKVNYLVNNKMLTMIKPEIRGETDSMSGVTRDEGTSPATWDCNVEFINDSEFKVRLEDVKVSQKIPTGFETVVSESPNIELESDKSWDKDFKIEESPNVPELESEIVFTPLFGVITRLIGEIIKEPFTYHIMSAEVHKTINPTEIAAYANTDISVVNTILNKGTSTFDTLEINDEIPPDFVPPSMKEIKIEIKNPEATIPIHERAEFIEKFEISPDDKSPDKQHTINIKLKDLKKHITSNSEIIMSYPLLAKNPKPEINYGIPLEIKVNSPVKGKEFIITDLETPVLKIKYVARKLKTLKSVKPGLTEGEFMISLRIQNKGDVELENIIVRDKIPSGFTLSETNFDLPYELVEGAETELEVKIAELKGQDSININYNCSGSGDYPRSEPSVIVKGRGSSKAPSQIESSKPAVSQSKQMLIHDVFTDIFKSIEQGINGEKLGVLLEKNRDILPPGPILHQLMAYAKELKSHGEKIIVGGLRDDVEAKLKDFKSKYE